MVSCRRSGLSRRCNAALPCTVAGLDALGPPRHHPPRELSLTRQSTKLLLPWSERRGRVQSRPQLLEIVLGRQPDIQTAPWICTFSGSAPSWVEAGEDDRRSRLRLSFQGTSEGQSRLTSSNGWCSDRCSSSVLAVAVLLWVAERSLRGLEGGNSAEAWSEGPVVREAIPADSTTWQLPSTSWRADRTSHHADRSGWLGQPTATSHWSASSHPEPANVPKYAPPWLKSRGCPRRSETVAGPFLYVAVPGRPAWSGSPPGWTRWMKSSAGLKRAVASAALFPSWWKRPGAAGGRSIASRSSPSVPRPERLRQGASAFLAPAFRTSGPGQGARQMHQQLVRPLRRATREQAETAALNPWWRG